MERPTGISLADAFATLVDPRVERCKRHALLEIITIALCGMICGADSWVELEAFRRMTPLAGCSRRSMPRRLSTAF